MQKPPQSEKNYYINIIISIIVAVVKNYTRIYTNNKIDVAIKNYTTTFIITKDAKDIREREKDMIKLFCRIQSM